MKKIIFLTLIVTSSYIGIKSLIIGLETIDNYQTKFEKKFFEIRR